MAASREQRILLVEVETQPGLIGLKSQLSWAELDKVRIVRKVPADKRHNAKVDYTKITGIIKLTCLP
jgi:hypothetical protein